MFKFLKRKLIRLRQWYTKNPRLGLEPLPKDNRDFKLGFWFGRSYDKKHTDYELPKVRVISQRFNCCGWFASTGAKEVDEKVNLSARSMVIAGKREGYVSGDGFSNLRNNEIIMNKFGVCEESLLKDGNDNWAEFSSTRYLTSKCIHNATEHKSESYWRADNLDEVYEALDDGRPVKIGINWYRGFNMSGGFKAPFIIKGASGSYAGGHALRLVGYKKNYHGFNVFKFQNTFGVWWGDGGYGYIDENYLLTQIKRYGAYVNMDMPSDVGKFMMENDGKNIKIKGKSSIYHLQKGKKKPYLSWLSYLAWNAFDKGWIEAEESIIKQIPDGEEMDVTKSPYWDFLVKVKKDKQLDKLLELLLSLK